MIDNETMNQIIPYLSEVDQMEEIQQELSDEGFIITNFNKGGIFYHLTLLSVRIGLEIKDLARTIVNACFMRYAENEWLDIKAADYSKVRKDASKTQGYITINRETYDTPLVITQSSGFKTLPDAQGKEYKFYVMKETIIDSGVATGQVLTEAEEAGTAYNLLPNKINISMIYLEGVESVTNADGWIFREGTEEETDDQLRERLESSFSELAVQTIDEKLINAAKSVTGVLYAYVDSQHPRGQGTVDIIITGSNGEASPDLLAEVLNTIEPLRNNYEDFQVISSEVVKLDLDIAIYLDEYAATDGIAERAEQLISDMMALTRGRLNAFYRDSVIQVLSNHIPSYITTVFNAPTADILLDKKSVIVLGALTIEVTNIVETSE